MKHVRLGRTGLQVSKLCLGTMTFAGQCDEATSLSIMDAAAEAGITFIDTADIYPLGHFDRAGATEEVVGRWLKGKRHDFVLATKCNYPMGKQRFHGGNSRRHILDAVDASLRRLGTDFIDVYQLHAPDPETPIEESLAALDSLVQAGKVRYAGLSNFAAWELARANGKAEANRWARIDSIQPRYNLLYRVPERELLALCEIDGIGVIPYNPLAGGLLTGKHRVDAEPATGTRFTLGSAGSFYRSRYWHPDEFAAVEAIAEVASELGISLVTLSVAWVLANPTVTAPIIGASRPEQLADNVAALDVHLGEATLTRLDEITRGFRMGDALR